MPVDDKFFQNINPAQIAWYQAQLNLDAEEEFEFNRYFSEYNAMFFNPDGVRKIRETREKSINVSNEDFESTIKDLFGKELLKDDNIENIVQEEDKISQYLDMNLDEVKFIPFNGEND